MIVTTETERALLREAGRRLATIVEELAARAAPGVNARELDAYARTRVAEFGDTPAFLHYTPLGATRPYPGALCVSVNDEVVHGIPNETEKILDEGDVVTLDMGLFHEGLAVDMAHTIPVGVVDVTAMKLIKAAYDARSSAIDTARAGHTTGDIGAAVEQIVRSRGFAVARELGGHGIGRRVHEDPFVPNFGKPGTGTKLVPGMVLAIEPIVMERGGDVILLDDGYTFVSRDGTRAAQFEHTVIVTNGDPEILTEIH